MTDPLSDLVGAVLELPADQVGDEVSRASVGAWTSLRHLQLVAAVEDSFGVALTPREIRAISSVRDLRQALRARGCPG
jgi:acyl carrier protein